MRDDDVKILSFLCLKWGYGAADMAGTIRAQYPVSLRTVLVPCTGRVGADVIMRGFGRGADGILVVGWYPGECDYEKGNYFAHRSIAYWSSNFFWWRNSETWTEPNTQKNKNSSKKINVLANDAELKKWELSWRNGMHHTTHRFYITLKYKILKY